MNVKLLFVFLITLNISEVAFGNTSPKKYSEKKELKIIAQSRRHRSVITSPFLAYYDACLLSIEQDSSSDLQSYTITIKDTNTDEAVLVQSATGNTDFSIEGLFPGEYKLEIETETLSLYGYFIISDGSFGIEE